jgi:PucR C-terminal helix-turn-helix domain/GGDEF-like domain
MRIEEIRSGLVSRLRARRGEIEQAVLLRVYSVSEPAEAGDPGYAEGLRAAVLTAVDYGVAALELSEDRAPPLPTGLLAQARLAARSGVELETVLRRYLAGYTVLGDFVIEEAGRGSLSDAGSLRRLLRAQAALFDRVLLAIGEEYSREQQGKLGSAEQRRVERVQRLLAGELLDISEFAYPFEGWHLGILASGPDAAALLRPLAARLDRILLLVQPDCDTVWAWLGGRERPEAERLIEDFAGFEPARHRFAIGELGEGLGGWRLTHRQAAAALPVARRSPDTVVRYADVALLASIMADPLLTTSLRGLYLEPLERDRAGGEILRATLRAYLEAGQNVSSAAAALRVKRHTVTKRLRTVEELVGRPLASCTVEIAALLRLESLGDEIWPQSRRG